MTLPAILSSVKEREYRGIPIYEITEPNVLTQVMGWLKFREREGQITFRGQTRIYDDMSASGFRDASGRGAIQAAGRANLAHAVTAYVDRLMRCACSCPGGPFAFASSHMCVERVPRQARGGNPLVADTFRATIEPLLQHYGLRTRWLDVVDNVWVALWFACHGQQGKGRHAFHLRRSVAREGHSAFAYVAVLNMGIVAAAPKVPGYWVGESTRVVDLRQAVPSQYLRPHAQHGLLVAPATLASHQNGSLASQVVAYLEIRLVDAIEWLGTGAMTSPYVLFPPAAQDEGYRRLLDHAPTPPAQLGTVTIYGPGI